MTLCSVETEFDYLNYKVKRPLPQGKNQKVFGLMKVEVKAKIPTKFVAFKPNT